VPVVDFLAATFRGLPEATRDGYRELLLEILDGALYPHPSRSYPAYEPARHPLTRRLAAYSANLTVLLVLLSKDGIGVRAMFPGTGAAVERWIEHSHLWKAQLTASEWNGLVNTLRVRASRDNGYVDVTLAREDGSPARLLDSFVISPQTPGLELTDYDVLLSHDPETSFDLSTPAGTEMGLSIREDGAVLPAYLLSLLDYTKDTPAWERAQRYGPALEALPAFPALEKQVLLRLRDDARILPVATTVDLLREASRVPPSEAYLDVVNDLWARNSGKTSPGIGGRGMIIALVRALHQKWPEADLDRLAAALRTAAYGKRRPSES
jgi:hypothetical protein